MMHGAKLLKIIILFFCRHGKYKLLCSAHTLSVSKIRCTDCFCCLQNCELWIILIQHCFGSVSEHFMDRTRSMCRICSVVFVYFI